MKIIITYRIFFYALYIFVCSNIRFIEPSFDGAMNLLESKNFALFGNYYSYYFDQYFPHFIQTRVTLQIPAAILIKFFGVSSVTLLLTSASYTVGFIYFFERLINKLSSTYNYFILPLFLFIPYFFRVGLLGYGEVIAYFFIVIGLLFWIRILENKNKFTNYFLMGFFVGLGVLTKTVAIITAPCFLISIIVSFIFYKKIDIKYLWTIIGLVLPMLVLELIRLNLIGMDAFLQWWNAQGAAITQQAIPKSGNFELAQYFLELKLKLILTAKHIGCNPYVLLAFLLLPSLGVFHQILKNENHSKSSKVILLFIIGLIAIYSIWWFQLQSIPKIRQVGKIRRFLPALIFNFGLISFLLKCNSNKVLKAMIIIITLAVSWSSLVKNYNFTQNTHLSKTIKKSQIDILNNLPNTVDIYGSGFKQSPGIALHYKHHFKDIQNTSIQDILSKDDQYLIFDRYSKSSFAFSSILECIDVDTIVSFDRNYSSSLQLLKIKGVKNFSPGSTKKIKLGCYNTESIEFKDILLGDYQPVKSTNWCSPISIIPVSILNAKGVSLKSYLPRSSYLDQKPKLAIYIDGEFQKEYSLIRGGAVEIDFKFPLNYNPPFEVEILCNSNIGANKYEIAYKYLGSVISEVCIY